MNPTPHVASVNLKAKMKIDGKWTFVPVARKNNHYVADLVMIGDVPTKVKGVTYYVEWRENGKRIQKAAGKNAHEAIAALKTQAQIHGLRASGVTIEEDAPLIAGDGRLTISAGFETYLDGAKLADTSLSKYKEALHSFAKFTDKRYVDQVRREDIEAFLNHMEKNQGLEARTRKVKGKIVYGVLTTRLKANFKMERGDWPKVVKKSKRKMYRTEILKRLLATVPRERYILYLLFLHTGFREREVANLAWSDVNWDRGEVSVTAKPALRFKPKNYEERHNPVVPQLMDLLREHRRNAPEGSYLVFPTQAAKGSAASRKPGGKPMLNMLDLLKLDYFHAGLNCGNCLVTKKGVVTSCAKLPQCKNAGLHMFRHTYATNLLRQRFTLTDVCRLLGQRDEATTAIYLHELENDEMSVKLNETSLGDMYTPDAFNPVERKRIHLVSDDARRRMSEGGKRSAAARAEAG